MAAHVTAEAYSQCSAWLLVVDALSWLRKHLGSALDRDSPLVPTDIHQPCSEHTRSSRRLCISATKVPKYLSSYACTRQFPVAQDTETVRYPLKVFMALHIYKAVGSSTSRSNSLLKARKTLPYGSLSDNIGIRDQPLSALSERCQSLDPIKTAWFLILKMGVIFYSRL